MSSSKVAHSDDMLTSSPRLDSSGVAPYDSDLDSFGEEVSEDDYWALKEAQAAAIAAAEHNVAATSQHLDLPIAPQYKNKHIGETKRCVDNCLEEHERAVYGDESKEAASISTVLKGLYANSFPRTSRAKNNAVIKRKPPKAESTNGPERHNSDDMQIDSTSTTAIQAHRFDGDTGRTDSKSSEPKRGESDLSPFYHSMPPSARYRFIDNFMQVYQSSSDLERRHIQTRLAECHEKPNVDVAPTAAHKPPLPPVTTGGSHDADLSAPARSAERWQTRPLNKMQQPDGTATDGMDVIHLTDLTSDSDESEQEASSGNAPGFNSRASNDNKTVPQYEFYGRECPSPEKTVRHSVNTAQAHLYNSSYGPPTTTYIINQFIEGSSRDALEPFIHPAPNLLNHSMPSFEASPKKRPHGLGWENGRSPNRRRVVSSPGYIDSSSHSSSAAPIPPSSRSFSSSIFTTEFQFKNNDHAVNYFFKPCPDEDQKDGWTCIYRCPVTSKTCDKFLGGRERRNRFRHLAIHAHYEEECIAIGLLKEENALLVNRLKKVVVGCAVKGCGFRKEVWRTDGVREDHEEQAHPEIYQKRKEDKKKKKELESRRV